MRLLSVLFLFFISQSIVAQEIANFSQFFVNPYIVNPSFAGIEGKSGLYLTYRMQWVDFDGAPTVANASFHNGLSKNLGMGFNVTNDKRGALNTSSALLSFSYAARLGNQVYLRFGASGGLASNGLDFTDLNPSDPAFTNALENNAFLIGNVGLSLHIKSFHFGASMPDLFKPQLISEESFSMGELMPTENFILSMSNRFYFSNDNHVFEPYVLYRYRKDLPNQLEAAAIMHLNHTVWFGGTYKQDFGISAAAGFKIPTSFGLGYSYTFKNLGVNQIQSPTHEVTVSLLLGKKKAGRQKYSFVNTILEVEVPPTPVTLAPKGTTPQEFCTIDKPTVEDLRATGTTIKWYESSQGGVALGNSTQLVNNKKYYATQTVNNSESKDRLEILVKIINPAPPIADQLQSFQLSDEPTIENLTAEGEKVIWYLSNDDGLPVKEGSRLNTATYFASQVLDGCESADRIPVQVELEEPPVIEDTTTVIPTDLMDTQTTDDIVVVKRGGHMLELPVDIYVIVGVFSTYENADKFSDNVFLKGYHDTKFGYISERGLWYVFVHKSQDGGKAREIRDSLRKRAFLKAWVLEVKD